MIQRMTGLSKSASLYLTFEGFKKLFPDNVDYSSTIKSKLHCHVGNELSDEIFFSKESLLTTTMSLLPSGARMNFKIVNTLSPSNVIDFHIGKNKFRTFL